jgi:hypothetical protein
LWSKVRVPYFRTFNAHVGLIKMIHSLKWMTHSLLVFRVIHIRNGGYVLKYWYLKYCSRQSIQVWSLKVDSTTRSTYICVLFPIERFEIPHVFIFGKMMVDCLFQLLYLRRPALLQRSKLGTKGVRLLGVGLLSWNPRIFQLSFYVYVAYARVTGSLKQEWLVLGGNREKSRIPKRARGGKELEERKNERGHQPLSGHEQCTWDASLMGHTHAACVSMEATMHS